MARKKGYRLDGTRVKRPDSHALSKPKKIHVLHGGGSRHLMTSPFDMRTAVGKWCAAAEAELVTHLGGVDAVTATLRPLVAAFVRTQVMVAVAQQELLSKPMFTDSGESAPAFDTLLRAQDKLKALAETLGLQRQAREIPNLSDYIQAKKGDSE